MAAAEQRDRIVAVFSTAAGWEFNCEEHTQASDEVRACVEDHEAIAYRAPELGGASRHEFPAMVAHLLAKLAAAAEKENWNWDSREGEVEVSFWEALKYTPEAFCLSILRAAKGNGEATSNGEFLAKFVEIGRYIFPPIVRKELRDTAVAQPRFVLPNKRCETRFDIGGLLRSQKVYIGKTGRRVDKTEDILVFSSDTEWERPANIGLNALAKIGELMLSRSSVKGELARATNATPLADRGKRFVVFLEARNTDGVLHRVHGARGSTMTKPGVNNVCGYESSEFVSAGQVKIVNEVSRGSEHILCKFSVARRRHDIVVEPMTLASQTRIVFEDERR